MAVSDNTLHLLNFKNCKRCRKPFSSVLDYTVCPACMKLEEERFNRTRDYIYAHGSATEEEILARCDITPDELTRWIREEKISLPEQSPIFYPCEACGELIHGGHFCLNCKLKLHSSSGSGLPSSNLNGTGMRHFHHI